MKKALSVYFNGNLAGTVAYASDGFSFEYEPRWLASRAFIPLSVTLPRAAKCYGHRVVYPYFENLLPESKLRTAIARARGVDSEDIFELLEKFAGDCAGAVSLMLPGTMPAPDPALTPLGPRKIKALMAQCGNMPLLAADPLRRATLAGSQQKTPVRVRRGRLFSGSGNAPTSHVLKPDSEKLPHSTANEAFCMKVAARVGLPVAGAVLLQCGTRLLVIPRSDRAQTKGRITRVHEIDFCQAGNCTSLRKYEKDGGPGLARLFALGAQFISDWPRARSHLIRWVIFNYLIGNRDTHAKNLSLTLHPDRIELTPFYDLLSTAVYPKGEKELALKIGGQNRPHAVGRDNWRQFARDIKVEWAMVESMARNLSAVLPRHAAMVAAGMRVSPAEQKRIRMILRLITRQSRYMHEMLA